MTSTSTDTKEYTISATFYEGEHILKELVKFLPSVAGQFRLDKDCHVPSGKNPLTKGGKIRKECQVCAVGCLPALFPSVFVYVPTTIKGNNHRVVTLNGWQNIWDALDLTMEEFDHLFVCTTYKESEYGNVRACIKRIKAYIAEVSRSPAKHGR